MDHCLALDSNWTAHSGVRRNYQYHVPCSKQLIHLTWPSELVAPGSGCLATNRVNLNCPEGVRALGFPTHDPSPTLPLLENLR